jgi:hypothetical protein
VVQPAGSAGLGPQPRQRGAVVDQVLVQQLGSDGPPGVAVDGGVHHTRRTLTEGCTIDLESTGEEGAGGHRH